MRKRPRNKGNLDPNRCVRIWVPRHISERLSEMAKELGVTKQGLSAFILKEGIAHYDQLPTPPSVSPMPTAAEAVAAFTRGEKLLGPCGDPLPCGYNEEWEEYNSFAFCKQCRVRLR